MLLVLLHDDLKHVADLIMEFRPQIDDWIQAEGTLWEVKNAEWIFSKAGEWRLKLYVKAIMECQISES